MARATSTLAPARLLVFLISGGLLAGAWGFQVIGGLSPCEMCHWQRWPHYLALLLALASLATRTRPDVTLTLLLLAAIAILVSGAIGVFHLGVERHWWQGPTHCTAAALGGGDPLAAILRAPLIRCDVPQWTLFGVSLAAWNALFSFAGGIAISLLCLKPRA